MTTVIAFLVVAFAGLTQACAGGVQSFPENGTSAISHRSEFGAIIAHPDTYQGQAVRLAGRIIGVQETETGTLLLAKWMPFPDSKGKSERDIPNGLSNGTGSDNFSVFYPGKLDGKARWRGNEFLAIGTMEGNRQVATMTGRIQEVPALKADCLRIWTTAGEVSRLYGPTGMDRNLPSAETYCRDKQL